MGRKPTESGLMHQRFAREYGCKVRQARNHHAKNTPEWQAFVAGGKLPRVRLTREEEAPDETEGMTDLEKAAWVKGQAWKHYCELDRLMMKTVERNEPADVVQSFARSCQLARKQWEEAKRHETALKKEAKLFVSCDQVLGIRDAIAPLSDVFRNLKTNIASKLQPEVRLSFYAAFEGSMPAWNAGVKKVNDYIQNLVPGL